MKSFWATFIDIWWLFSGHTGCSTNHRDVFVNNGSLLTTTTSAVAWASERTNRNFSIFCHKKWLFSRSGFVPTFRVMLMKSRRTWSQYKLDWQKYNQYRQKLNTWQCQKMELARSPILFKNHLKCRFEEPKRKLNRNQPKHQDLCLRSTTGWPSVSSAVKTPRPVRSSSRTTVVSLASAVGLSLDAPLNLRRREPGSASTARSAPWRWPPDWTVKNAATSSVWRQGCCRKWFWTLTRRNTDLEDIWPGIRVRMVELPIPTPDLLTPNSMTRDQSYKTFFTLMSHEIVEKLVIFVCPLAWNQRDGIYRGLIL